MSQKRSAKRKQWPLLLRFGLMRSLVYHGQKRAASVTRCSDSDICILAARGLRKQVKAIVEHLGGVRLGEDIECVHRARVASRRLRAVLAMYGDCWKRKQVKGWQKQIRKFGRGLSEARDHDVQIEFLAGKLAAVSDAALVPGIARLLSHAEQQRQWLQPRVVQAVDCLEGSGVLKEMQAAARRLFDDGDEGPIVPAAAAHPRAAKKLRKRLKKLLVEASGLKSAEHVQQHHAMRIATKRLRYMLELARPRQSPEFDATTTIIKKLQTLLGEIHDCDVWAENLAAFTRTEAAQIHIFFGDSRRFNRLLPGLEYLRDDRKARREQAFDELVAFWQGLTEKRVWEQLAHVLEADASV